MSSATEEVTAAPSGSEYLRYLLGQGVSILGDQVWFVGLSYAAVRLASPSVAGLVLGISALPRLALLLLGGALVDRYEPRALMIGSDGGRAVIALGVAGVAVWHPSIALLVVAAVLFGAVDALFLPAAGALQPRLLLASKLSGGTALRELVNRAALTLGAPLGGLAVGIGGLPLAGSVDAATFAVSLLTLCSLRARPPVARPARERLSVALGQGLRYLARHRLLRAVIVVSLLVNLGFVGPMNVGLALLSDAHGWGAGGIGALLTGFGLGAAAGAAVMLRLRVRRAVGVATACCAAVQAAALLGLGLTGHLAVAVVATAVAGMSSAPLGVLLSTMSQAATDDGFRGRVSSVSTLVNLGITPLVMAVMGAAVQWFGLVPAFAGSALLVLAGALTCLLVPDLRHATLTDGSSLHEHPAPDQRSNP